MKSQKAIIIGAGIADPAMALFLKKAGIESEIYESYSHSTDLGGPLNIAPNGMHVLDE